MGRIYLNSVGGVTVEVSLDVQAQHAGVQVGSGALVAKRKQDLQELARFGWAMDSDYPVTTIGDVSVKRLVNVNTGHVELQVGATNVLVTTKKDLKELERLGLAIVPHALPYANDARWLGKIRATAAARYRDDKLDISDCGAKVRKLIEEAVVAEGIQILVKQVSLFTPEFEDRLKTLKTEDARASEMEHAIRHEIHVKLEENPAFFVSLRERLEQIIEDRKAKRIDAAQQLKLFEALKSELRGHADAAEKLGLTETGFAIYGLLRAGEPMPVGEAKGKPYSKPDEGEDGARVRARRAARAPRRDRRLGPKGRCPARNAPHHQASAPGGERPSGQDRCHGGKHRGPHEAKAPRVIERSQVQYGKTLIPYAIRRTDREKTVALTIEARGKLVVSAPGGVSVDRLNRIVREKAPWVIRRARRVSDLPPPPTKREFVSGETILYLGRQYRLRVIEGKSAEGRASLQGKWLHVSVPPGLAAAARRRAVARAVIGWLKQHASSYIPGRLETVAKRFGVTAPNVVVREQRRRWGSCDARGTLRINWRIIQAPPRLIDYVLAHELVHLRVPTHGPAFWRELGRAMPDYEARRARLREVGPSLVW